MEHGHKSVIRVTVAFGDCDPAQMIWLPVKWRDRLLFETSVRRVGRSSLEVAHTVSKDEGVCVEASEVRVWSLPHPDDPKRLKGFPIPPEVVARLTAPTSPEGGLEPGS
jgi:4-hydroxybenzoyl-CoA thioesterase